MTQMNFTKDLTADVLSTLNWATADEAYTPSRFLISKKSRIPESHTVVLSAEPESGSFGSERHKTRLLKRKTASDALFSIREELFSAEFEA